MRATFFLFLGLLAAASASHEADDVFTEDLTLKELPSGLIAAFFEFDTTSERPASAPASHFDLFPKNIGQLVYEVGLDDMRLTLTRGTWNHEAWGPSPEAAPPGAELWASLPPSPEEDGTDYVEGRWGRLASALAGLFCASLQFIARDQLAARQSATRPASPFYPPILEPVPGPGETRWAGHDVPRHVMYGTLPREAVCTENLTPWARLLPCRKQAGVAALLQALPLLASYYLSFSVRVTATPAPEGSGGGPTWRLTQALTVVLPTDFKPWSLATLFGARAPLVRCPVAARSAVHVLERPAGDVGREGEEGYARAVGPWSIPEAEQHAAAESVWNAPPPDATVDCPGAAGGRALRFDLPAAGGFNISGRLGLVHPTPDAGSALAVERFLSGGSLARGLYVAQLTNRRASGPPLRVLYSDPLPAFVTFYSHTLQVDVMGRGGPGAGIKRELYIPPIVREESATLSFEIEVPAATTVQLSAEFDKLFMRADEYPPDPHRGLDVGSAIADVRESAEPPSRHPLPRHLAWCDGAAVGRRQYTGGLLVMVATPDFSMPYNVIAMTSTVVALFIGSHFNVLTRRPKEEARKKREAEERAKLRAAEGHPTLLQRLLRPFRRRPEPEKQKSE